MAAHVIATFITFLYGPQCVPLLKTHNSAYGSVIKNKAKNSKNTLLSQMSDISIET